MMNRVVQGLAVLAAMLGVASGVRGGDEGCEPGWVEGQFGLNGLDGSAFSAVMWNDGNGDALYVGGNFSMAGSAIANNIARWDGSSWSSLAEGVNSSVLAMAVFDDGSGPALYAAGLFTEAGGNPANRIARWDGSSWSPLNGGLSSTLVTALAVFDDGTGPSLYAGGRFGQADGQPANNIARWDGVAWSTLGNGLTGGPFPRVSALEVFEEAGDTALYVGGQFSLAGTTEASNIARWDGSTWSPLGSGANSAVDAIVVFEDEAGPALFAGGFFTQAGGTQANRVARWDGSAWSALGGGLGAGSSEYVTALTTFDDGNGPALYASGNFTAEDDDGAEYIARWNGTTWSTVGKSVGGVSSPLISVMVGFNDGTGPMLYIGGNFTEADGSSANRIARWSGSGWSRVGDQQPLNSTVLALTIFDDGSGPAVYAGGTFTMTNDVPVNYIARWDRESWSALGSGTTVGLDERVYALTTFDAGSGAKLYAGGIFTHAGEIEANNIACWDGSDWLPLGAGMGASGNKVEAMQVFDDGTGPALYAAGLFGQVDGIPANRIARWDGGAWSALGAGVNGGDILSLAVFDDGSGPALYVGGRFTEAGGKPANRIARWDGTSWSEVGAGVVGDLAPRVAALCVYDDGHGPALYAAGLFAQAGEVAAANIARWDGTEWQAVGAGVAAGSSRAWINTMTVFDDGSGSALYAGGFFTEAGGSPATGIARWDGSEWSPLAEGVTGGSSTPSPFALATVDEGSGLAMYVGGNFTVAGQGSSLFVAKWQGCFVAPAPCPDDVTGDNAIDLADLNLVLANFGQATDAGDATGDREVNKDDLNAVLAAFGTLCP